MAGDIISRKVEIADGMVLLNDPSIVGSVAMRLAALQDGLSGFALQSEPGMPAVPFTPTEAEALAIERVAAEFSATEQRRTLRRLEVAEQQSTEVAIHPLWAMTAAISLHAETGRNQGFRSSSVARRAYLGTAGELAQVVVPVFTTDTKITGHLQSVIDANYEAQVGYRPYRHQA